MNVFDVLREKLEERIEHCLEMSDWRGQSELDGAIEIVNQVEQEYKKEIKRDSELCDATSIESAIKQFEERLAIPDYREQIPEYHAAMETAVRVMKNIPKPISPDKADYAHEASYIQGWNECLEKIMENK